MRGKYVTWAGLSLLLCACSELPFTKAPAEPERITWQEESEARQYAEKAAPGSHILALCGGSRGYGLFLEPENGGWSDDGISDGRIMLLRKPDGSLDLLFRDAFGQYVSALEDAQITPTRVDDAAQEYALSVTYPQSGAMESYSFLDHPGGGKVVLWTSNKPGGGPMQIRKVFAFQARCAGR